MSNSDIKPIQINPALFTIRSKGVKNKTVKNLRSVAHIKPNKLKTELITKIKNYKQNHHHHHHSNPNPILEKDNNSLALEQNRAGGLLISKIPNSHLPNLSSSNNSKIPNSIKNEINDSSHSLNSHSLNSHSLNSHSLNSHSLGDDDDFSQSINFLRELSSKTKNKTIKKEENSFPISLGNSEQHSNSSQLPHYSCLKNGSLPTYREWKNKTLKKPIDESSNSNIPKNPNNFSNNDDYLNNPENFSDNSNKNSPSLVIPKKTTTLKYYLGKRGKKVSVLIKNSETRKKIHIEHNLLKQTNISDMKNYLKRHNLLKSGSYAPPEIIKKLYEQSLLGGDIRNSNKTNIIHNYLTE